jgi:hypothetical protein
MVSGKMEGGGAPDMTGNSPHPYATEAHDVLEIPTGTQNHPTANSQFPTPNSQLPTPKGRSLGVGSWKLGVEIFQS